MKGLHPLLATSLLILIVVAAWSIVGSWLKEVSREHVSLIENKTKTKLICSNGNVYIISSKLNATSKTLFLRVKNIGDVELSIDKLFVIVNGSSYKYSFNLSTLIPGETISINTTVNQTSIDEIFLPTNCPEVYDRIERKDILIVT